jgi:hypothetical protein
VPLRGGGVGILGPITNVTSLRSDIVDVSPKRGRWGRPRHGTPRSGIVWTVAQADQAPVPSRSGTRCKPTSERRRRRSSQAS